MPNPTSRSYSIRLATVNDAPGCAAVNIAAWRSTYRGLIDDAALDNMDHEQLAERWHNRLMPANRAMFCFVAQLDPIAPTDPPHIVGYVLGGFSRRGELPFTGELLAIYLLPEHQGAGLGRRLFLRCVQEFRGRGIDSFLLFVLKANVAARKFYSAFHPDFEEESDVMIDGFTYRDVGYGWSNLDRFPAA